MIELYAYRFASLDCLKPYQQKNKKQILFAYFWYSQECCAGFVGHKSILSIQVVYWTNIAIQSSPHTEK